MIGRLRGGGTGAPTARRRGLRACVWALALGFPACEAAAAEPARAAVFDFEMIDTSLEGEMTGTRPDEWRRLEMIGDLLRRRLAESGRYTVIDQTPASDRIAAAGHIYGCNGCEVPIARDLGADLAITGTVQKVSNLILNINVYVSDAHSGQKLRATSVDIRGNTDRSWSRGLDYLVENRLLKP